MRDDGVLGYDEADRRRLRELGCDALRGPEGLRGVLDRFGYLDEWRTRYCIRSVRASLHASRITCIDAAILSYGLLELLFPRVKRRLLAIHRRDPKTDEECGHCVALFWGDDGMVGALSKSSFAGLGHREAVHVDEHAVAESYAAAYLAMDFEPLYFGVSTLEEVAPEVDWRLSPGSLNVLSERLQATYAYAFALPSRSPS